MAEIMLICDKRDEEVQFLENAIDDLHECRLTLMYSIVFRYYVKYNNHTMIFDNNLSILYKAVESLSGCLEREMESFCEDEIDVLYKKVMDLKRYGNDLYLAESVSRNFISVIVKNGKMR